MILEHRTYTFKPGTVDKWMKKYEAEGLPIRSGGTARASDISADLGAPLLGRAFGAAVDFQTERLLGVGEAVGDPAVRNDIGLLAARKRHDNRVLVE